MLHKAWNSKEEMPYCFPRSSIKFQGHMVQNITDFDPNWAFPDYRPVAAFKSLRFALFALDGHSNPYPKLGYDKTTVLHDMCNDMSPFNKQELICNCTYFPSNCNYELHSIANYVPATFDHLIYRVNMQWQGRISQFLCNQIVLQWPLVLTWLKFNPSMDRKLHQF